MDRDRWVEKLRQTYQRKTSNLGQDIGLQEVPPILCWLLRLACNQGTDFPYHMPSSISSCTGILVVLSDFFNFELDQPLTNGFVFQLDLQAALQRSSLPQTDLHPNIIQVGIWQSLSR